RFISIWPIDGSAGSGSMAESPITPPSPRTGMAGSARAICCGASLRRCIREGLVGGEAFAVDASLIKADANRQKGIEGEKALPPQAAGRAGQEDLAPLDDAAFGAPTAVPPKLISPPHPAAPRADPPGGRPPSRPPPH